MTQPHSVTKRVPARLESIRPLTVLVKELANKALLNEQAAFHCQLALDEACVNIIQHAYPDNPSGEIEVAIHVQEGECAIHLTDFGEPYDPEQIALSPVSPSIEEAEPGGLGLYLMRKVMDEIHYAPGPEGNCLVMVKRNPPSVLQI